MSTFSAFLVLTVLPIVFTQTPNPVGIWWFWKMKGPAPIPPAVAEKVEVAGRFMLPVMEGLVTGIVLMVILGNSISAKQVGLDLHNWGMDALLGCAAAVPWVLSRPIVFHILPAVRAAKAMDVEQNGSAFFWICLYIFGAFAEELWRALCIFGLIVTGHHASMAVGLTAISFALAHVKNRLGGMVSSGIHGVILATLFVWRGSLVAPCLAHLFANLGHFYWLRRAGKQAGSR